MAVTASARCLYTAPQSPAQLQADRDRDVWAKYHRPHLAKGPRPHGSWTGDSGERRHETQSADVSKTSPAISIANSTIEKARLLPSSALQTVQHSKQDISQAFCCKQCTGASKPTPKPCNALPTVRWSKQDYVQTFAVYCKRSDRANKTSSKHVGYVLQTVRWSRNDNDQAF